jgi:hypothetical protein
MSWMSEQEPILGYKRTCDALDLIIVPRVRDLGGGFSVHRALPHVKVTALLARLTADNASGHCHVATAFGLMAFTRKPRRRVFPWIASLSLLISIMIQSAHVGLIEVLFVPGLEIVADVGEVEAGTCALRDQIYAIRIADAIIVDHRRDGLPGD